MGKTRKNVSVSINCLCFDLIECTNVMPDSGLLMSQTSIIFDLLDGFCLLIFLSLLKLFITFTGQYGRVG